MSTKCLRNLHREQLADLQRTYDPQSDHPSSLQSGAGQGKFAVLPLCYAANTSYATVLTFTFDSERTSPLLLHAGPQLAVISSHWRIREHRHNVSPSTRRVLAVDELTVGTVFAIRQARPTCPVAGMASVTVVSSP